MYIRLRQYYHLGEKESLFGVLLQDFFVSIFLFSGSGLLHSIAKGVISHIFLKAGWPILIGKNFKVIKPSFIKLGNSVWIKENVTLFAGGEIVIGDELLYMKVRRYGRVKEEFRLEKDVG